MHDELYSNTTITYVDEIGEELLQRMAAQIKPLVMHGGRLWTIEPGADFRTHSFLWDPRPDKPVGVFGSLDRARIVTFHKYGAPVLFKPSIAEVMAGILRYVDDWSHIGYFYLESHDMDHKNVISDCHWCICRLFGKTPIETA